MALGSLFDAEYSLLSVAPRRLLALSSWNDEAVRDRQIAAHEYLRGAMRCLRRHSPKTFGHFEVTNESVANAIVRRAESSGVDCIAMARRRRESVRHWLTPSVTHRVIELAQVPILVIPPVCRYAAFRLP
jgi:nucleotide-binding universal stress UspA family protein